MEMHNPDKRVRVEWKSKPSGIITPVKVTSYETLNKVWPYVRDRVEIIKRKDKATRQWQAGHVRQEIMTGLAGKNMVELFVGHDESECLNGFLVTQIIVDPFVNLPTMLFIWLGWLNRDMIELLTPYLDDLARERGLEEVAFESGRFGWTGTISKLKTSGFTLKSQTFHRKVR